MTSRTFNYQVDGLWLFVTATQNESDPTKVDFTIECKEGSANINALYFSDGQDDGNVFQLAKSLNMQGSGEDWDYAVKLSDAGLTKTPPPTYLTADSSDKYPAVYTTSIAVAWDKLDTIGIRATSTSTAEGSIKAVVEGVPVDTHHNGNYSFGWDFENHPAENGDNTGTPLGFWNLNQWAADHPGVYGAEADASGFSTDIQVHGEDGHRALDTAASPGNIFIQAIPAGRDGYADTGTMPDLVAGKEYHAEAWILKQDYPGTPATPGTDPNASVDFQFNDKVFTVHASDIAEVNQFVHIDLGIFKGVEGEDDFQIMSHGTANNPQGLLIDQITVHDWII